MGKATKAEQNAGKMEKAAGVKGGAVKKNNAKQAGKGKAPVANGKAKGRKNVPQKKNKKNVSESEMESSMDVSDLLGTSLVEDSDENDVEVDEKKGIKMFKGVAKDSGSDEEDSDESDDPGCEALIGKTLLDDTDDKDFEIGSDDEDEDDDISEDEDEDDEKKEKVMYTEEEKAALDKKSIYIGNVPSDITKEKLKAEFSKFGDVEAVVLKKFIVSKSENKKVTKVGNVYLTFKTEESAKKAVSMNGKQLNGFYLRVNLINQFGEIEPKKAVFVGNLPYATTDNDLWEFFKNCGKIEYVHVFRLNNSTKCRGTAYVVFTEENSVALALNLNDTEFKNRKIRVGNYKASDKKRAERKKRPFNGPAEKQSPKKAKTTIKPNKKNSFQGQKATEKKSPKNKMDKKKKQMAKKLTTKPKKPTA